MGSLTRSALVAAVAVTAGACFDFDVLVDDCVKRGGCIEDSGQDAGVPDSGEGDAGSCLSKCAPGCQQRRSDGGYGQYVSATRVMPDCSAGTSKCNSVSCGGYVCAATACSDSCANTSDCTDDSFCNTSQQCVPKGDLDATCLDPEQCKSRRCTHRGGILQCNECQTSADCNAKSPLCDLDAGRCVGCSVGADCVSAGLGSLCVAGRCECVSQTCSNVRATTCHADAGCGCGAGGFCLIGQVCTDAGTCLLVAKQPCVGSGQCVGAFVNGACQ